MGSRSEAGRDRRLLELAKESRLRILGGMTPNEPVQMHSQIGDVLDSDQPAQRSATV